MPRPQVVQLDALAAELATAGCVWALPRFRTRAEERLGGTPVDSLDAVPAQARVLAVVGGGSMIDEAKLWRRDCRPGLKLAAVPTLWGSGAEASRVVALTRGVEKRIEVDEALLPDLRAVWPELAAELPSWRAREACGDAWSHAIEGFLSPLGSGELREEIAVTLSQMLALPLGNDPGWFEASADACAAQARAGVGLVHGIAHVLEGALAGSVESDARPFGHARLCSIFLAPVLALNRDVSAKFDESTAAHGVDGSALLRVADELFDEEAYDRALPVLEESWRRVLRDPCTRTNSSLVRPAHLDFFLEKRFR